MRIHFIAIGGSAMHSLALEMQALGHEVSGSDDTLFEPSKSKLEAAGLLPDALGWFPEKITSQLEVIVLGMHAKKENPELKRALELNLTIQSYPEFIAAQTQNKTRVVIAGSHGKTTITSMVLHALNYHDQPTDFMVGAPLSKSAKTFTLSAENDFILLEGDEYLSSALDSQPKFLWYTPEIALISGIAWDHVNVFPTYETYKLQFEIFIGTIRQGGVLVYNEADTELKKLVESHPHPIKKIGYHTPQHFICEGITYLVTEEGDLPLQIFGAHNLQNLAGAQWIAQLMGIDSTDFFEAILSFKGASKRLELMAKGEDSLLFKDFAHAPSKVEASCQALKRQFEKKKLTVCLELHTYSSLDPHFIKNYAHTLASADEVIVFYDAEALQIKNRAPLAPLLIEKAFQHPALTCITEVDQLHSMLLSRKFSNEVLVMMSSGSFGRIDWEHLKERF